MQPDSLLAAGLALAINPHSPNNDLMRIVQLERQAAAAELAQMSDGRNQQRIKNEWEKYKADFASSYKNPFEVLQALRNGEGNVNLAPKGGW